MNKLISEKVEWRKLIYPLSVGLVGLVILGMFMQTAVFLSRAINSAFLVDNSLVAAQASELNLGNFLKVRQKLGLLAVPAAAPDATATQGAPAPAAPALKVVIWETPTRQGQSSGLVQRLTAQGFTVLKVQGVTSSESGVYLQIKDSFRDSLPRLKESLVPLTPSNSIQSLPEGQTEDAIILLGK